MSFLTTQATVEVTMTVSNESSLEASVEVPYNTWQTVVVAILLSIIIVGTIIGNILVCTAVAMVRKLRTPSNLLIVSLAVSDLLVALLVMPFAAMYELMGRWVLGQIFCDTWTSLDVMLCTASILNLCIISVDRYFVITRPFQYAMKRTPRRMALMITAVWLSAALISIPPVLGWKNKPRDKQQCGVSQDPGYQFYATIGAFYLPLCVMIVIYYRIYMVSSRIARGGSKPVGRGKDNVPSQVNGSTSDESRSQMLPKRQKTFKFLSKQKPGNSMTSSRDSKATKTLGVIMGAFTACWLPFFILALIKPFCSDPSGCIPHWLGSLFLWLGFANSFLNPIIYARFNREFRTPFKEILLCRCRGINERLRTETYQEQYGSAPLRDVVRPPTTSAVHYQSQGNTIVKLGNGDVEQSGVV